MTFPTAGSTVYYNEDGEVLGWDAPDYDAPDYDAWDYDAWDDDEIPTFDTVQECEAAGLHALNGDGNGVEGEYICAHCEGVFTL
jgi:hypothetical protein